MCNYFMTLELFVMENIMCNLTSAVTRSKRHNCVILQNHFHYLQIPMKMKLPVRSKSVMKPRTKKVCV